LSGLTLDQLRQEVQRWSGVTVLPSPDAIAVGGKYGDLTRTRHVRGLWWELTCPQGHIWEESTNDFPKQKRCPTCERNRLNGNGHAVDATQDKVKVWFTEHDGLIWMKVHDVMKSHHKRDDLLARELHALVWEKISAKADQYQDRGHKVTAWLGTVANNILQDHFKQEIRRSTLANMTPLLNDDGSVRKEVDWPTPQVTHSNEPGVTQGRGPLGQAAD